MSLNITKTKARISTVTGAYKITSAMKLVSSIKLSKYKNEMLSFKRYQKEIESTVNAILGYEKNVSSPLINFNEEAKKDLYIVVSSSLGLCGAYNANIFALANANIKSEDDAIIFGEKGITYYKDSDFNSLDAFKNYKFDKNNDFLQRFCSFIEEQYLNKVYRSIHIIYTEYKNSISFIAKDLTLLPIDLKLTDKESNKEYIIEPDNKSLLNTLFNMHLKSTVYSCLLEAEVSEQASRNLAMDNATKNAEELLSDLKLEFNKARQSAITQEIIEIVSASNNI